jgi:PAS domain S-box-containing protein
MFSIPVQNAIKVNVLDEAPVIISIQDTDQNIVWANKAYCKATGRSLQNIQGKKCYSIWGLSHCCRGCPVTIAIETGEQNEAELTPWNQDNWPTSQGSWLSKASPLKNEDGIIIGGIETAFEITDIKEAQREREQLLYDKEERVKELKCLYDIANSIQKFSTRETLFQDVVSLIPNGLQFSDIARGKITFEGKEYFSKPFKETEWKQSCDLVINGETLGSIEVYYLEEHPFLKEEKELIEGITISIENAIMRNRAEEELKGRISRRTDELKVTEEMLSKAFENSPIGKALVALDGSWLKVNTELCRILGYSEKELLAKTFQAITHPEDLGEDLENVNRVLAGEINTYEMEKRYVHKQGHFVWAQLNVSLVRGSDSDPLFFVSQIQDITQRRENARALIENRERFELLTSQLWFAKNKSRTKNMRI